MADILDGMIYAAIMATLTMFKEDCNQHECCMGCELKDDNGVCLLFHCPEKYDLDKIRKALLKDGDTK